MEKTNNNEYSGLLNKIKNCLYVIIVLLIINLFVIIIVNGDPKEEEVTDTTNQTTSQEEVAEYDVSMFEAIDVDGLKEAFNSDEIQVVYFGRETCGYCVQFLPILQQAQEEFGYQTLYVDVTTVDEEGMEEIQGLDSFLEENYGTTPLVILVKDGELIEGHIGYAEYDTFAQFLTDNGVEAK